MNKLCCLIMMFINCGVCIGQNLVPNPSFEDTIQCPQTLFNLTDVALWQSFSRSPDYFNSCATASAVGVPNNTSGNQFAKEGNAYIEIICYATIPNNAREYAAVQLLQPLSIGAKYFVKFFVSTADAVTLDCGCNKLGARFSTNAYSVSNPFPIDNFAHIYTDSIIYDKINWVEICGSVIADSSYQYLILGNFFDDANTDTTHCANPPSGIAYAMYYLDAVSVSTDSLTCNAIVGTCEMNNTDDFVLFPNPFNDKINITTKRGELVEVNLFDITARKIFNQSFTNSISINTEQLANGIYIYEVRNKNRVIKKGKIVKNSRK